MNGLDQGSRGFGPVLVTCRATVCLWSDSIEEKVEFTTWLTAWRKRLTYLSHDYGCAGCIHLFDVEGPGEAIDALPLELLMTSAWTERGVKPVPPTNPHPSSLSRSETS